MSSSLGKTVEARIEELKRQTEQRTQARKKMAKSKPKAEEAKMALRVGTKKDFKFSDLWGELPAGPLPDFAVSSGVHKSTDFDKQVQAYVPEDEPEFVPSLTEVAMFTLGMNESERVLIYGPTGSGKSTLPKVYAARTKQPFYRIPCRRDMEASDLFGSVSVRNKDLVFSDGPVTLAARYGGVVCLDEVSVLQAGAALSMQYTLENGGKVILPDHPSTDPSDKIVNPHPSFRIVLTDNTSLGGDHTGHYVGTNVQNQAFRNRINKTIRLGYLPVQAEIKMVVNHVPEVNKTAVADMVRLANEVRTAFNKGNLEAATISPRNLIQWAKDGVLIGDYALAFRYCFMNSCSPDDETVVSGLYRKVFGVTP